MKTSFLVIALMLATFSPLYSQIPTDTCRVIPTETGDAVDRGICDTVRIGCPINIGGLAVGDSFSIPIYVWHDVPYLALSFGFRWNDASVRITSVDLSGSILPPGFKAFHSDVLKCLFAWADLTGITPIPASAGGEGDLLCKLNMRVLSTPVLPTIDIDTAFYPPAGRFNAISSEEGGNGHVIPIYEDCGTADIITNVPATPVLVSVQPNAASQGDNLWVTITGQYTNFGQGSFTMTYAWFSQGSSTITSDNVLPVSPTVLNAHFNIPLNASPGFWDVYAQEQGESAVSLPHGFQIVPLPRIASVTPDSAFVRDHLWVTITGVNTHFGQSSTTTQVKLEQSSSTLFYANTVSISSPTLLQAEFYIPPSTVGLWDIVVSDMFNYYEKPYAFRILSHCGDVDGDGSWIITDCVYLVNYVFGVGYPPIDSHHGDIDCDGSCNIADIVYLLNYIFGNGAPPCANCP